MVNYNDFMAIGEQNGVIKRIKGILSNSKPNPEKLFIAEGIWMNGHILSEGTEIVTLVVWPEYIRTQEDEKTVQSLKNICPENYTVSAKTYAKIS